MKTEKLYYELPAELIAQEPVAVRSASRLLVLNRSGGEILDSRFDKLGDFLSPGDCLVLNDTKVIPARFFARRSTGARLEGLFLNEQADGTWTAYLKGTRKLKPGDQLYLKDRQKADFCEAVLLEKLGQGKCLLKLRTDIGATNTLEAIGFPPLPPYIRRDDNADRAAADRLRYQTVYARHAGAVAAPTAGLHFTQPLIKQLEQAGVCFAFITLHVGAGTFKPITAENLEDHEIHEERFGLSSENAAIINEAKTCGGRIIPVGTTSTRVLETIATNSKIEALEGSTRLFITPDYTFKMTDAMITNFHLPRSTLLALVAAFAGLESILTAYRHAVERRYRFYSYGDAMLII
jgi:S-adenosylmethionine:tRNA ribosyltransferase-isomerase